MKEYLVKFEGNIAHNYDYCYILAKNDLQAITLVKEKHMLDEHPLTPDFLNKYCRYTAKCVSA